jgi:hypothetical protein
VSQQTTDRSFDDLARALAEGSISRRRALRLFAGTAIAALIPSRALAQSKMVTICHVPPGNPANAHTITVGEAAAQRHLEQHPGDTMGSCQTSPTTTTSTSTSTTSTSSTTSTTSTSTSTTTPTTSTSTSTTSTSTTPMCLSNGGSCSANNQCCSGRCAGGMCAEPCPSGTVTLSNGTCAKLCTGNANVCTAANCFCLLHVSDQAFYCGSVIGASRVPGCMDDIACPPGEFCRHERAATECVRAC